MQKKYGFPKISTGDLLRSAVERRTSLGKKAKRSMDKGFLVSDDIVISLVQERMEKADCRDGCLLDGFPRNLAQADALDKMDDGSSVIVIDIHLDDKEIIDRLSARRICSRCQTIYNLSISKPEHEGQCDACGGRLIQREDDQPEVIQERLRVYHDETEKLIGYYQEKGLYNRVDGHGDIETVFHRICDLMNNEFGKTNRPEAAR
jgi:adenylate kinase